MANPDDYLYEYAVVRYVPRVDREEFVNIGLLMMCKRRRWMRGQLMIDSERIMAFDRKADIGFLERQASVFERSDVPSACIPVEERYRWLSAVKSAILQVSPSHPGHLMLPEGAADVDGGAPREYAEKLLDDEFERLFAELVLP